MSSGGRSTNMPLDKTYGELAQELALMEVNYF
jgi:hypothetical protein